MAKPKAKAWLREAFRDGVDERMPQMARAAQRPSYPGAEPLCWLADHDDRRRPCSGKLERFHFIRRQWVEEAVALALPIEYGDAAFVPVDDPFTRIELILLAAWDARNGGIACEAHHRRFDSHMTPRIVVPYEALPSHVVAFAFDWGIDHKLDRFPSSI